MKKITALLAGLMLSGVAGAVQLEAPRGDVQMTDCALLNEDVTINLTNSVVAGVSCDATVMAMAACHTAGRTTSRTQDVTTCTTDDPPVCTTAPETVEGPAMPAASTVRGTVTSDYPGGTCDMASAEAHATTRLGD